MAQLKKSEKRLMLMFFAILFVGGNYLLWGVFEKKQAELKSQQARIKNEIRVAEALLGEKEYWLTRSQWIATHKPVITSSPKATSDLLDTVEDLAKKNKIEVENPQTNDAESGPFFEEISVELKLKGKMSDIVKWAGEIQDPEKFRLFKHFSLKTSSGDANMKDGMLCTATIAQWCEKKEEPK